MKNLNTYIFGAACVALSGAAAFLGYKKTEHMRADIYRQQAETRAKMDVIMEKLDAKIDAASSTVDVDIPQAIVQKAIDTAVNREVSRVVRATAQEAANAVRADISTQVGAAVHEQYVDISEAVKKTVNAKVADVDISGIKSAALYMARDEFRREFKDLLKELKSNAEDGIEGAVKDIKDDAEEKTKAVLANYETTMRLTQAIRNATDGSSNVVIL